MRFGILLTLLFTLIITTSPCSAEIRVPMKIQNNTDATLTVTLMSSGYVDLPYHPNEAYGQYTVPPVTTLTFPRALRLGYTHILVEARRCKGVRPIDRTFYHGKSKTGVSFEFFPKDFGKSVMFDSTDRSNGNHVSSFPNLTGQWKCKKYCPAGAVGKSASIKQGESPQLHFTNEGGGKSEGRFVDQNTIIATQWGNLRGDIKAGGMEIHWGNGTVWERH